ncbi:hypothetical protein [Microbacterium luticocti]|uniref:hypothetical protein n=1 Tax=Microbacterium luticocti TaxID=451764 RepID=UPI0004125B66|nr:hypothetical protein [Microbacterium luticocti]
MLYTALRAGFLNAQGRGVSEQYIVELDRHIALMRADIEWTESLLARLAREDYPWGPDALTHQNRTVHEAMRKAAQQ